MIQAVSEGGQAAGGSFVFFVIVGLVLLAARHERRSEPFKRAKRKAEIRALLESRLEDADLFREVLDELGKDESKGKP